MGSSTPARLHAFVAMPIGVKPGHDGVPIDFNRVYLELIRPALEAAGLEPCRAEDEPGAGDLRADLLQALLIADLVVVDLTLDDPSVWYELGLRHALRARGVIVVHGPRRDRPFERFSDFSLRYSLREGAPDPDSLAAGRERLADIARRALAAPAQQKPGPIHTLFDHLREPGFRELLAGEPNAYTRRCAAWSGRLDAARINKRAGDILVLAEEAPFQPLRAEARRAAGICLLLLGRYGFAVEQFESALALDPDDKASRAQRIRCLSRLGRIEEAGEQARLLCEAFPADPEVWSLAGEVAKLEWIGRWARSGAGAAELRQAAAREAASLDAAITACRNAFIADPSHYRSGLDALMLTRLRELLGLTVDARRLDELRGGVLWACRAARLRDPDGGGARTGYAELCVLTGHLESVVLEYRHAVAAANGDWFALQSMKERLELLRDLGFRPPEVDAALAVVNRALDSASPPFEPRQVLLFSGHMVDAPGRRPARFPAEAEPAAVERLDRALENLGAGPEDLALAEAAAGGDLLFLEACRRRGVRCVILLPFAETEFICRSIQRHPGSEPWLERFHAIKAGLQDAIRSMPEELGPTPEGVDPYERCNRWLLYSALAWGPAKVRFICLWNGAEGDGPGGTAHMYHEVERRGGQVTWIDTREL